MKVVIVEAAERDIEAIGESSEANYGAAHALRLMQALRRNCAMLADMSERYPLVPRYERSGIRRSVQGPFLIFYRVETDVRILRVLHGAMDWEAILFP